MNNENKSKLLTLPAAFVLVFSLALPAFAADAGKWSYQTCKTINTFGNVLCAVKVSGQAVQDALEFGARFVDAEHDMENGGFLHVAGLTYEIDLSVPNTVQTDDKSVWLAGPGKYRVTNVRVYDKGTGAYVPLELDRTYTIAGANYTLLNCGDGFDMFGEAEKVLDGFSEDYLAFAAYVAAFADKDGDGLGDIASANSPLSAYKNYRINYEDPTGSGRTTVAKAAAKPEPAPKPESVPDSQTDGSYTVVNGDYLWRIARTLYGDGAKWRVIYEANRGIIKDPNLIWPGQVFVIPAA